MGGRSLTVTHFQLFGIVISRGGIITTQTPVRKKRIKKEKVHILYIQETGLWNWTEHLKWNDMGRSVGRHCLYNITLLQGNSGKSLGGQLAVWTLTSHAHTGLLVHLVLTRLSFPIWGKNKYYVCISYNINGIQCKRKNCQPTSWGQEFIASSTRTWYILFSVRERESDTTSCRAQGIKWKTAQH